MTLPTEPIGSIPRPPALQEGMAAAAGGRLGQADLEALFDDAVRDTLRRFEETGSTGRDRRRAAQAELRDVPGRRPREPGARRRDDPVRGRPCATAARAHLGGRSATRRRRSRTSTRARPYTSAELKQAVISASAISLMYPAERPARLPARGLPRRPRGRGGVRDPRLPRSRRAGADRLHRGAAVPEARPVEGPARRLRRPQQPRPGRADGRASGPGSASTAARAATRTRRTARTSRTRTSCRPCSGSTSARSTSSWRARPIPSRCSGCSGSRRGATGGSSWA